MSKFLVTFTTENKVGKIEHVFEESDSLTKVARMLITFKPKRNSELVHVSVERYETLV